MKTLWFSSWVLFAALCHPMLAGDVDTSHHKAVYSRINDMQGSLRKVTATGKGGILLTGWIDGGELVKIVAKPGNAGSGVDEFYLEGGDPLFVFSTAASSSSGAKVEERIYFEDGQIVEWLSTDKTFVPHGEDFTSFARQLKKNCKAFSSSLKSDSGKAEVTSTAGTFLGIEEGDYFHWKMRTSEGEEASYFLLKPDAALQRVIDDPQEYEGRKCRVKTRTSIEDVPEAGGKIEIEQIVGVEWL